MDDLSLRFDGTYTAWQDRRSQHKRSADLFKMLLREYRKVWETGDERGKIAVLWFVRENRTPGGEEIVWSSLRSDNRNVVAAGLAVAVGYVLHNRAQPDARAVSDLVRIVRDDPIDSTRVIALHVLTLAKVEGLDSWLQELAEGDQSPDIRREANRALMRKGDARAKAALLDDIRQHPGNFGVADDLWQHRQAVDLTADEELEVRGVVLRYMQALRRWLRRPDQRRPWVGMVGVYVRDGFPFEEEDVELMGRFAASGSEITDRLYAVDALAAFDTPRARQWLERLASGGRPKEVVGRARRALRAPSP